jgi:flavin-dependent dehydrogenase
MGLSGSFDVIVVGGGPGGAISAKRCAESGLSTLLIEKKALPRDKVCSGMVMGEWAHGIIRREFGEIPPHVLTDPPHLDGHRIYVAGAEAQTLEWHTPLAWRKDLDSWMVQGAATAGADVSEGSTVIRVTQDEGLCRVITRKDGISEELQARFVIGADGGTSVVRRSMFPKMKVRYSAPSRKCYRGILDLEKSFIHWFFPKSRARPRFNINFKDDVFLIEGSGIKDLKTEIGETLSRYGFQGDSEPEWIDGCAVALLHEQLLSGVFVPADGNMVLVGDAAGFILPITFEGIGTALKSGILAAESIVKSADRGRPPADPYLESLHGMVEILRHLCSFQDELKDAPAGSPDSVAKSIRNAYRETLVVQSS